MSLTEIISDAIKYPFSDITKFAMVGVLAVLAGFSSVVATLAPDSTALGLLAVVISFIFALILSGYCVDVIKKGIEYSDEIPDIDLKKNLINGFYALIIGLVYFIIPILIVFILAMVTGVIGAGLDHILAALGFTAIIAIIIFIVFAIFEMIALARFADTGDLGAALSIGEVLEDVKKIGFVKILGFIILTLVIIAVAYIICSIFSFIPFIGIIIAMFVSGAFIALFSYKALGLLYAEA
jgi:hypothetical protein